MTSKRELPDLSDYPALSDYLTAKNKSLFTFGWLAAKARSDDLRQRATAAWDALVLAERAMGAAGHGLRLLDRAAGLAFSLGIAVGHDPDAAALVARMDANKKAAASTRHAQNRDARAAALAWYAEHGAEFANKDDAALAAYKIVPLEVSTLRRLFREPRRRK